jgi:hypothetical protein
MNFKIAFVGAALMAFGGLFAVGCGGNACEDAATAAADYLAACPKPPAVSATTTSGTAPACTDAAGTLATCQSAAITSTPCDCLGAGDAIKCTADQSKAFLDALAKCK